MSGVHALPPEERRGLDRAIHERRDVRARVRDAFLRERARAAGAYEEPRRSEFLALKAYSTCCAVQNFWLAARAEGVGVGWVSIVEPDALRQCLDIPAGGLPIAYLCVGYVSDFQESPDLERAGWRARLPLAPLVFEDRWGVSADRLRATLEDTP